MGYRSDVRIKLKVNDFIKLVNGFNAEIRTKDERYDLFNNFMLDKTKELKNIGDIIETQDLDILSINEETFYDNVKNEDVIENIIYFGWNSVKWYDSYEDVKYIMNFIEELDCYAYARIGEEYTDIEWEDKGHLYIDNIVRQFDDFEV